MPTESVPDILKLISFDVVELVELILPNQPTLESSIVLSGGVVSCTLTVKEALAILPFLSKALQETLTLPIWKREAAGGVQVTFTIPSTASVATILYVITIPSGPVASKTRSFGTVITGGMVSTSLAGLELDCA